MDSSLLDKMETDADCPGNLTEEDELLIRDLMIQGRALNEDFDQAEYRCFQPCYICKNKSSGSSDFENGTFDAMDMTGNDNDFSLDKDNRKKIIEGMVHHYFKREWRAKRLSKDRLSKIQETYNTIPIRKSFKAKEVKTNSQKTTSNSQLLKTIDENTLKSVSALNKEAVTICPLIDFKNKPIENETPCVSKAQIVPKEDKNSNSTESSTLKHSNENKIKSNIAINKKAVISQPSKTKVDLQNEPIESEMQCVSNLLKERMEEKNINKLKPIITINKEAVTSRPNKINVDLQNQPRKNETPCASKTQTSAICMKIKTIPNSLAEISKLKHSNENKLKSIVAGKIDAVIDKCNVALQGKPVKNKAQFVSEPDLLRMDDKSSPFYIDKEEIDISTYQEGLDKLGWNPTQVLYEICSLCKWQAPQFKLVHAVPTRGFLFSVTVNNTLFLAKVLGQTKKSAKHFASSECLAFIGFKVSYKNTQLSLALPEANQNLRSDYTSNRSGGRNNFNNPYSYPYY